MKHIFIVNKISGNIDKTSIINDINRIANKFQLDYVVYLTEYKGHAKKIVEKYKSINCHLYSIGGDGTLSEVLNGMDLKHTLSVIPAGSGNDFYRYFTDKDANQLDIIKVLENEINKNINKIDCGLIIDKDIKFINFASFGIDAKVGYDADKILRKNIFSKKVSYLLSILKNIIILKKYKFDLLIDGKDYSDTYHTIAIFNGKYYGNGVKASMDSSINDGYFDVVLFKKSTYLKAVGYLQKYMDGTAVENEFFKRIKCKNLSVYCKSNFIVSTDGETFITNKLEIKILEQVLQITNSK